MTQITAENIGEFSPIQESPEDRPHRSPSRALVAAYGGIGVVLEACGTSIEHEIGIVGFDIVDLGLSEVDDGLSVWEGEIVYETDYDGECESFARGEFRELTAEEWASLQAKKPIFIDVVDEKG